MGLTQMNLQSEWGVLCCAIVSAHGIDTTFLADQDIAPVRASLR